MIRVVPATVPTSHVQPCHLRNWSERFLSRCEHPIMSAHHPAIMPSQTNRDTQPSDGSGVKKATQPQYQYVIPYRGRVSYTVRLVSDILSTISAHLTILSRHFDIYRPPVTEGI